MSNNQTPNREGNLLVITAPSGAGKSTLVKRLLEYVEGISFSVSYTTRMPRIGEETGREYFFVSIEEFEEMRKRGEFLEWAHVHHNYYGTHSSTIKAALAAGQDIILDIDVQGAAQVKQLMPQAILIFVMPPSYPALVERLNSRGLDTKEVINRRLQAATLEVARYREFDFVVINDDLDTATRILSAIVLAERQRGNRIEKKLLEIIHSFEQANDGIL